MPKEEQGRAAHWATATAEPNYKNQPPVEITINDRAATRQAIIRRVRENGMEFVERSDWGAYKNRPDSMVNDWHYRSIAIHHAGRSAACGPAALQLQEIQSKHMERMKADDIGYHYAIDCLGNIYEGRDIRFKGEHVRQFNTAVIGIVLLENLADPEEGGDLTAKARTFLHTIGFGRIPEAPSEQRETTEKFIKILREFFNISVLGGHKEFPHQTKDGKICPGKVGLAFVKQLRTRLALSAP